MRKEYTILCPQMSPLHFGIFEAAFKASGYNLEVLPNDNKHAVDVGLKYVNNDACYPSLMVVGQIMDALLSGKYDLNKNCSHHVSDRRRLPCLQLYRIHPPCSEKKTGMEQIPVISLNLSGLESNPGFKLTLPLIRRIVTVPYSVIS